MIYLSWSPIQLVTVLLLIWLPYIANIKLKIFKVSLSSYSSAWAACALFVLYFAFDVGNRQQGLDRGRFDAQAPEQSERVARETMSRNDAKQTFEQAVKEAK